MLTRFLTLVISLVLIRSKIVYSGLNVLRFCATLWSPEESAHLYFMLFDVQITHKTNE